MHLLFFFVILFAAYGILWWMRQMNDPHWRDRRLTAHSVGILSALAFAAAVFSPLFRP